MNGTLVSVKVEKVTKLFGAVRALAAVSMEMNSGDVVAVMGGNGAGKSTLLSIISLMSRPTRGSVLFNEAKVGPGDLESRGRIGLLSHNPLVYPELTGKENLELFAKLYGLKDIATRIDELQNDLKLGGFYSNRPVRVLSRGQLQRISLARALIARPQLLLLDEPAAGLDMDAVDRIGQVLVRHQRGGGMAVVVTHEPELASVVANRAIMIRGGKIAADVPAPSDVAGWRQLYMESAKGVSA